MGSWGGHQKKEHGIAQHKHFGKIQCFARDLSLSNTD
jgi:hypothetical protein